MGLETNKQEQDVHKKTEVSRGLETGLSGTEGEGDNKKSGSDYDLSKESFSPAQREIAEKHLSQENQENQ